MTLKLLLLLSLGLLSGCNRPITSETLNQDSIEVSNSVGSGTVTKVTIDGCDYMVLIGFYKGGICPAVKQPETCSESKGSPK